MKKEQLDDLRVELSLKAKNGIDFIIAASIIWLVNSYLWILPYSDYNKSIFVFIAGGMMLPLAFGLSKILKTNWKVKNNALQPLGLWLNFAQLFYFPFLVFVLIKCPDYFIMAYAIITGAHLFPYAWFYDEIGYAVTATLISVGSLLIALNVGTENIFYIPIFTSVMLFLLALWILIAHKRLHRKTLHIK